MSAVIRTSNQTCTLKIGLFAADSLITANCQFSSVVCQTNKHTTLTIIRSVAQSISPKTIADTK